MNNIFSRNFLIFVIILVSISSFISFSLISGEKTLASSGDLLLHTYDVIFEAEELSTKVESMLASQRGYVLTQKEEFYETYETRKSSISENIVRLFDLTIDNPSQQARLAELQDYYVELANKLDDRASRATGEVPNPVISNDVQNIDTLKNNIIRINMDILGEEYELLNQRINTMEQKKSQYFTSLLIGVAVGTILLLIFNAFLLRAQQKRNYAEESLKGIEERLSLAIEGTQDGIFDWNVSNETVFYSRQFFAMLGYDKGPLTGTPNDSWELVHPEDFEELSAKIELYLSHELSEFVHEYRMKHKSGRWVWVQSRAKAIYDRSGHAIRMVGAHTDITSIVKERERLEIEKEEAEEANKAKGEFLAHMSHEIRTPLTAISGISEILGKQIQKFDDKQAQLIKTLGSSTASLKELINDILDFSKIEKGEVEIDERVFSLETVFQETISMMAVRANEKGISFVFDYSALEDSNFYGDSKRLRQILVNLIGNAIKFTDKGGVTIKADIEDRNGMDFLRIDVSDTGIGISPDDFDLVFEKFKQADSSVSRKYGGTGLGLPISKNLARIMGGDIFVSSQLGKGSSFSLLLPAKINKGKKELPRDVQSMQKLNDKIRSNLTDENKVLIAEDYEGNIVVVTYILEEIGLEYDIAYNGQEAVNLWQEKHYDMILMDVQMPEMDGFTATKEIRKLEERDNLDATPIIGMTAHALIGDKDKCVAAGMDSYLPKPLVEADLKREILKFLKNKDRKVA